MSTNLPIETVDSATPGPVACTDCGHKRVVTVMATVREQRQHDYLDFDLKRLCIPCFLEQLQMRVDEPSKTFAYRNLGGAEGGGVARSITQSEAAFKLDRSIQKALREAEMRGEQRVMARIPSEEVSFIAASDYSLNSPDSCHRVDFTAGVRWLTSRLRGPAEGRE